MRPKKKFLEKHDNKIRNLSSKKYDSQDSIPFIKNKKIFKNRIKGNLIEKSNRKLIYDKISSSSFQSGKNTNYQCNIKNNINIASNLISTNSTNYICPSLFANNILETDNKFNLNENCPNFLIKNETNYNKLIKNNLHHIYPNNLNNKINNTFKTATDNVKSILEKKIKIVKKPKTCETTTIKKNKINKSIEKSKVESELEYRYQKMFERRLPLNDLRCYKSILFEENNNPRYSTQYEPKMNKNNSFINSKTKN